jgi:hypothetical protein
MTVAATTRFPTLPHVFADLEWQAAPTRVAAVSWWGADHEHWTAELPDGTRLLAKRPRPHYGEWIDAASSAVARQAAADAGVGPAVLATDTSGVVTVETYLDAPWRVGTLTRLAGSPLIAAVVDARARFRRLAPAAGLREVSVLSEIHSLLGELGGRTPVPYLGSIERLDAIAAAVADGPAPVPGWGSSEISDVMVTDSEAKLLGGGRAGIMDPLADVGALLADLSPYLLDPGAAFSLLWPDDHPGALARARLYAVLADLHAVLWGYHAALWDPTSDVNHLGYAIRRTWRLRAVSDDRLDALIADAGRGWS